MNGLTGFVLPATPPDETDRLRDVVAIYREALERIAGAESGLWGWIAHEALREARHDMV